MSNRQSASYASLAVFLLIAVIGCSSSNEETEKSARSKTGKSATSARQMADIVVASLAGDEKAKFKAALVPTSEELRDALKATATPRDNSTVEDQIAIDVSLERLDAEYPAIRRRVLESWSRVRAGLQERGIDVSSLKVGSIEHKTVDEFGITMADNVRIHIVADSRKVTLIIDHCIRINGEWKIVGEWRLAPDATPNTVRRKE